MKVVSIFGSLFLLFHWSPCTSSSSSSEKITPADIDELLRLLNLYRGMVVPTAANMHRLVSLSRNGTPPETQQVLGPEVVGKPRKGGGLVATSLIE